MRPLVFHFFSFTSFAIADHVSWCSKTLFVYLSAAWHKYAFKRSLIAKTLMFCCQTNWSIKVSAMHWLHILRFKYFACPICGDEPEQLVLNGQRTIARQINRNKLWVFVPKKSLNFNLCHSFRNSLSAASSTSYANNLDESRMLRANLFISFLLPSIKMKSFELWMLWNWHRKTWKKEFGQFSRKNYLLIKNMCQYNNDTTFCVCKFG